MKKRVYIGGVEVFLPDPTEFFRKAAMLCDALEFEMLSPFNPQLIGSEQIFQHNWTLLQQADAGVMNLNVFRGSEPDSGTCFEAGVLRGQGKIVVGYYDDGSSVAQKARRHFRLPVDYEPAGKVMPDGMLVEGWDFPVNLMLAKSLHCVHGTLVDALKHLQEVFHGR